jgi:hypothetical protein
MGVAAQSALTALGVVRGKAKAADLLTLGNVRLGLFLGTFGGVYKVEGGHGL